MTRLHLALVSAGFYIGLSEFNPTHRRHAMPIRSLSHRARNTSLSLAFGAVAALTMLGNSAQAQDIQTRTIKFPSASNKGHPQVQGVEKFAEIVKAKSGGKLTVQPFPGGVLGPDLQVVSAMQGGTVEMNVMNASLLAGNVKEMALFDVPYLVATPREADALVDGPIGRQLLDKLQEKGLVGLAYWDLGFRQMHTSKKAITKADEFKGMKMRVIPTPIYVEFMNAIGANAVPMPFTETYTALESGAIDGMTNPLLNVIDGKYNEVSKHLTLTNHMYTPQAVIVGKKFWDKLSADEQKILRDAATETAVFQRKVARDQAAKVLAELRNTGMQVHELSADDIAKLKEKAKPVIAKFTKDIGEPLLQQAYAEIEKVRAAK
jgi:TRAP-type transport system periplasmic protein